MWDPLLDGRLVASCKVDQKTTGPVRDAYGGRGGVDFAVGVESLLVTRLTSDLALDLGGVLSSSPLLPLVCKMTRDRRLAIVYVENMCLYLTGVSIVPLLSESPPA